MSSQSKTTTPVQVKAAPKATKLDALITLLQRPQGAAMPAMIAATGWQPHSIRGAMAGALKKKGHAAASEKVEGVRVWRIAAKDVV
jgi:hypothetical protein